jgi:hypothetical protein
LWLCNGRKPPAINVRVSQKSSLIDKKPTRTYVCRKFTAPAKLRRWRIGFARKVAYFEAPADQPPPAPGKV